MSGTPSEHDPRPGTDSSPDAASWSRVEGVAPATLEENWLFRLRRERFRSRASGREHDFYVMQLADAVHAVATTPDGRLVLVRQFRAASARDSLELPGGLVDRGEDPVAAGARELLEETGYAGDPPELLGTIYPIPALLSMRISTVVIRNARLIAETHLDPNEEVALDLVPARDIPALIKSGRIDHGVCVAGLLWWMALDRLDEAGQTS
jgi:8-oxo-dGTP pyrophosphatase MutT (NUDIX family)